MLSFFPTLNLSYVIIGNHAHVIQPLERYEFADPFSKEQKSGLIAYSLGNLVADFNTANSLLSILLRLQFTKGIQNGVEKTIISSLEVRPFYTLKEYKVGEFQNIRLLDFLKLLNQLDTDINYFRLSNKQVKELRRLKKLFFKLMPDRPEKIVDIRHI